MNRRARALKPVHPVFHYNRCQYFRDYITWLTERVISRIKELVIDNKIGGIDDVINLSDREHGLRIQITCKPSVKAREKLAMMPGLRASRSSASARLYPPESATTRSTFGCSRNSR